MKNEYLFANASLQRFNQILLSKEHYRQLIETKDTRSQLNFFKQHGIPISDQDIAYPDRWYREQCQLLVNAYRDESCDFILDVLAMDHPELSVQLGKKIRNDSEIIRNYAVNNNESLKILGSLNSDRILIMSYLRNQILERDVYDVSIGRITAQDIKDITDYPKENLKKVLDTYYYDQFTEAIREWLDNGKRMWVDETFLSLISQAMAGYRDQVIGVNGLVSIAYSFLTQIFNIRLILKAKSAYLDEELQLRMVRDIYV